MTELDRVLDVLLHDLRSPLSVASGYVRLLHQERLDSFEARDKAWTQTAAALTRIAHLCDEAGGFLSVAASQPHPIPADRLVTGVRDRCLEHGIACDVPQSCGDDAVVVARTDRDRLVDAVIALVTRGRPETHAPRVRASCDHESLTFTMLHPGQDEPPCSDEAYDPWTAPGLIAALACHTIALASGTVRGTDTIIIQFPLHQESSS